jgi:SET family sugar efflux transporter-like MFS transporter
LGVSSVTFGQVFAYARDLLTSRGIEKRDFPLYMNVFRLAFALSWTVGPACAAWMMTKYSFEGTFLFASALFLSFSLSVALFVPHVRPAQRSQSSAPVVTLRKTLAEPTLLAHFVAFAGFFACATMAMMNLPLLILNTLHGTETQVGWAFSVAPVFELPFMFYIGLLATRIEHGFLIRVALGIAAAYYLGLALVTDPIQVYPLQILGALIVAVMSGVAITFFQNFLPDQPGTSTNLYVSAQRLGSTLGYLLFGTLMGATGHRTIFAVCSLGAFFCFTLLFLARARTRAFASAE